VVDRGLGDAAQIRAIMEQSSEAAADLAIRNFVANHPELRQASVTTEIPAPLKWAGAIIAGLFTAGTATLAFWLVSTVSEMQVTLARMDERMVSGTVRDARVDDLARRVGLNENNIAKLMPQGGKR
jgi:uncharacterized membrane protein YoaK (UPF0700 family)